MELKRYNGYGLEHPAGTMVLFADVQQLQQKWQRVTAAMSAMLAELHRDGFVFDADAPLDREVKRWLEGRERVRTEYTADPEKEWQTFWRDIVAPAGTVDIEQVKKELSDLSMLLHFVPRVYMHVTGGRVSYPNTLPSAVCSVHDDYVQDLCGEARQDALDDAGQAIAALAGSKWVSIEAIGECVDAIQRLKDGDGDTEHEPDAAVYETSSNPLVRGAFACGYDTGFAHGKSGKEAA